MPKETKYPFPKPPRPSKKQHFVFAIPDVHVGYAINHPTYSIPCWDIMIQALRYHGPRVTHIVIMGDFGNWECLSHWASLRADQCFIEEDVALCNARLDEIEEIADEHGIEVIFLEGNHEAWATQFEAKYPALRDVVNLNHRLRIEDRGWTWVPENHFWAIGNLHFTHGHVKGCKNMVDIIKRTGVSVMIGHLHTYETETLRTLTGEHAAWTIGTLASMDPPPPYAKGSGLSRVVQGFATVRVRSNGKFQVGFDRIIGQTWTELADGTEIIADLQACHRRYAQDQVIRDTLRKQYSDRFYAPGGQVVRTEPHHGKTNADHQVARNRRARIVRMLPEAQ